MKSSNPIIRKTIIVDNSKFENRQRVLDKCLDDDYYKKFKYGGKKNKSLRKAIKEYRLANGKEI